MNNNYLLDKDFLKQLDYSQEKQKYVRIIALTNNDLPREEIIGRATGGSVNVDGASAVRRSCSLSLLAKPEDTFVTDIYWCYNNKFKLEIGVKNLINSKYPDIIWFNMGVYIITSFSKSESTNSLTISISGKDKMCRLNGEVSGNIPISTDFGNLEENIKVGNEIQTVITKLPIKTIIQNALKEYAQELPSNIIINDLDEYGYTLWSYRGNSPLYIIIGEDKKIQQITLNGNMEIKVRVGEEEKTVALSNFQENGYKYYSLNTLDENYNDNATKVFWINPDPDYYYYVAKLEYGDDAGYHQTPLIYNNDLVLNIGETVTSLLDKLKNMLGDFEYFYDLNGRFVFQKKKTYLQELFSPINGDIVTPIMEASQYSYKFEDEQLFTQISNTPNVNNLKNDFSIWGKRSGSDAPIHIRYAIDKKPTEYNLVTKALSYKKLKCEAPSQGSTMTVKINENIEEGYYHLPIPGENITMVQFVNMPSAVLGLALPEFNEKTDKDGQHTQHVYYYFFPQISINLKELRYAGSRETWDTYAIVNGFTNGVKTIKYNSTYNEEITKYSTDDYDWREIIYQMAKENQDHNSEIDYYIRLTKENSEYVVNGQTGYEQYYSDILYFWRQLYNPLKTEQDWIIQEINEYEYYTEEDIKNDIVDKKWLYWNKLVHKDPNKLNFWIDFLDTGGELSKYSIYNIGARTKAVNDQAVKTIYNKQVPEILYYMPDREEKPSLDTSKAYSIMQVPADREVLFVKSSRSISAIERANEFINQYAMIPESMTITAIPIYYLQPNTRIQVAGEDYTLDKISYSLAYNGTMNMTCNKIMKQI